MSRSFRRRLDALHHCTGVTALIWWRAICRTDAEADAARAAVQPGEGVIIRLLVAPGIDHGR